MPSHSTANISKYIFYSVYFVLLCERIIVVRLHNKIFNVTAANYISSESEAAC